MRHVYGPCTGLIRNGLGLGSDASSDSGSGLDADSDADVGSDSGERLLDDVEALVEEVVADDERRQEAQHIAVGATGQDQ
jgi:hypothetical protein